MSAEHFVTRGAFLTERVIVSGLPHQQGRQDDVHIDELVTNVLCKKHNTELSPLDQAFIDLINATRKIEEVRRLRARSRQKHHRPFRLTVDGVLIERCILKMVMNMANVMGASMSRWRPPDWLPDVVFGKRQLLPGCGVAMLARVGDKMNVGLEALNFMFGHRASESEPSAAVLELRHGLRFLCTWDRRIEDLGAFNFVDDVYFADEHTVLHPQRWQHFERDRNLALSMDFDWSGSWTPKRQPKIVKLRAEYAAPPRSAKRTKTS